MNNVVLAGRLVRDPELKTAPSGDNVCAFTVAVPRRFKGRNGPDADFFDCSAWRQTGEFICRYFKKGDGIALSGRLESRRWVDNIGNNRTSWQVVCESAEFPQGRRSPEPDGAAAALAPATAETAAPDIQRDASYGDIDEDLPF